MATTLIVLWERASLRKVCAGPKELLESGFGLLLWDGYRPQIAVDCFLRWASSPEDGLTKDKHYPNIEKAEIVEQGYVARRSGHSRGGTIDLTLFSLETGMLVDMGGRFDYMDVKAHIMALLESLRLNPETVTTLG